MDSSNSSKKAGMVPPPSKGSRMSKNDQKWEAHKEEIRRVYVEENSTLQVTMETLEEAYLFKASARKWKEKLKEWQFDKYLGTDSMNVIVAKAEKRAIEEGKETVFFHHGAEIMPERIATFKKRKISNDVERQSPNPATPPNVTYHTPRPDIATPRAVNMEDQLEKQVFPCNSPDLLGTISNPILLEGTTLEGSECLSGQFYYVVDEMNTITATHSAPLMKLGTSMMGSSSNNVTIIPQKVPQTGILSNIVETDEVDGAVAQEQETDVAATTVKLQMEMSLNHMDNGNLDDAISHLAKVIDLCEKLESARSRIEALSKLVEMYESHGKPSMSVYTYRKLIAEREKIFDEESSEVFHPSFALANVLAQQDKFDEAVTVFQKELLGLEALGMDEICVVCECFLGDLFRALDDTNAAEAILLSAFARCLRKGLKNFVAAPVKSLWQMRAKLAVGRAGIVPSVIKLDATIEKETQKERSRDFAPGVLFLAARKAGIYSSMQKYDFAETLFSSLAHQLTPSSGQFSSRDLQIGNAWACLEGAMHFARRKQWIVSKDWLQSAFGDFWLSGREHFNAKISAARRKTVATLMVAEFWGEQEFVYRDEYAMEGLQNLQIMLHSRGSTALENLRILVAENSESPKRRVTASFDGLSLSTRSCKYGVTYSVTDITGISDSGFMFP